jgi:hypothetical protein
MSVFLMWLIGLYFFYYYMSPFESHYECMLDLMIISKNSSQHKLNGFLQINLKSDYYSIAIHFNEDYPNKPPN